MQTAPSSRRSARPDLRPVRRRDQRRRHEGHQPEAAQGDRERDRRRRSNRGPVVAILAHRARTAEPSAVSLLRISRDRRRRAGGQRPLLARERHAVRALLERSGQGEDGRRRRLLYWKGERPMDPNAPQLEGTGEIKLESVDRGAGYFTTRANASPR